MDLSINFDFFLIIFKIYTQINNQIKNFIFILDNLIRNLQNTQTQTLILKKLKTQTQTLKNWKNNWII